MAENLPEPPPFDTDDLPTEMGSPAFAGRQPGKNAELVDRLLAERGIIVSHETAASGR